MKIQHVVVAIALVSLPGVQAPAGTKPETAAEPYALQPELQAAQQAEPRARWLGPDGEILPFRNDDEVLEFLRTARIVSARPIRQGINNSRKLLLEKDGVRAHAVFRTVDKRLVSESWPRRSLYPTFRDSFIFECAAYELSRLLAIHRVPPAVERTYKARRGSLQIWVENAMDEGTRREQDRQPPSSVPWLRQRVVRHVFDVLIHNQDRNLGNLLIDPQWNVWLIDHTRTFSLSIDLQNQKKILRCERDLWEKLRTVDRELVRARLEPYLTSVELKALFVRWDKLVAHLQNLIDQRGAGPVLVF